ncbi:hypothetical protein HMPREF0063_10070 [Aeromicrobium marinum DSM 15272]|uniref:Uncharacterized protein n=1 Tax=Aeromicrobium marinum DSM 15272 TaxID=585531 RepID=E2S7R3_9ACTN|nr:hypothetical protein [Aeromicrobium marinum]EFQ84729.1 hypothetical protein HMPREF0063_10070 [Aeromicrobium marinum DSM 15272]
MSDAQDRACGDIDFVRDQDGVSCANCGRLFPPGQAFFEHVDASVREHWERTASAAVKEIAVLIDAGEPWKYRAAAERIHAHVGGGE